MKNSIISLIVLLLLLSNSGCKKFLDEKPDKNLQLPTGIRETQALLDRNDLMNGSCPGYGEASADNQYVTDAGYKRLYTQGDKELYTWGLDIFSGLSSQYHAWSQLYAVIYITNVALDGISKVQRDDKNALQWDNVKGSALVFRARAYQELLFGWTKAYDKATAATDPGIALRMTTDFNERSVRADNETCYRQVTADLTAAAPLLPVQPVHSMRASRPAAYALLARTYLAMREYDSCRKYADLALQLKSTLIDYNTLDASARFPVPRFNAEVIMFNAIPPVSSVSYGLGIIDSNLYRSFEPNDLRRQVFFLDLGNGNYEFKGSYNGNYGYHGGEAVDELYLMRAECAARKGQTAAALQDLNTLLAKRWKTNTFVPITATDAQDALKKILVERRKELIYRDLRWMDIKRLNKEGAMISLHRTVNGQTYSLAPNDNRFALPFPLDVIQLSGMPQNER
ncbi:MAG TPA: RagB/SusD family nutrient uptake outer membrane protein [Chitinophagaceae bacterium]|nr:RagB/SusD family nutrient uptake outer membrane protein [Chitinophagaceae bacterium]